MKKWMKDQIIDRFKHLKFRSKLMLSYLFVILLPVSTLGILSYHQNLTFLEQQIEASTNNNISQVAYSLSSRLEKNNEFIRFTAFSPYVTEELADSNIQWYELSQKLNNYFEPLSWYNISINRDFRKLTIYANHINRAVGSFLEPSEKVKEQEWYLRSIHSTETNWFFQDSELCASRRIYDSIHQMLIGVVHMRMNTDYIMNSIFQRQEISCGFFLADSEGVLLYHYSLLAKDVVDMRVLFREVSQNTENGLVHVQGQDYYCASAAVDSAQWTLYYYTPSTYSQRANIMLLYMIATVFTCVVVMLIFVWLFSRTMVQRLERLGQKMAQVEGGNLSIMISSEARDEIGVLTNGFGRMLRRVNELIERVYAGEIVKRNAELKSLQSQINPHFLYNTLSMINWKAIDAEQPEISRIAALLSQFYRTSLNKGESKIIIKNELDNVKAYVELQLLMHENSFDVTYDIDKSLEFYMTINFTLQPLVENAILHGIDEQENQRGSLVIGVKSEDENFLLFYVKDNGIGMEQAVAESLTKQESSGYGLKNVQERIQLFFGKDCGIQITSKRNYGTEAILRIRKQEY